MKTARGLVDAGMAAVTSAEAGLIRGVAGSGKSKFTTGLRIRSKSDVETLCTCPHARRTGMMCEHALAVGLAYVRSLAAPVRPAPANFSSTAGTTRTAPQTPKAEPGGKVHQAPSSPQGPLPPVAIPGRFSIYLPEALLQGQAKEPFGVFLKYDASGPGETSPLATWLAAQGVKQLQSLPISLRGASIQAFLQTLAEHPRVFAGKPNGQERPLHVAADTVRPCTTGGPHRRR